MSHVTSLNWRAHYAARAKRGNSLYYRYKEAERAMKAHERPYSFATMTEDEIDRHFAGWQRLQSAMMEAFEEWISYRGAQ